MSSMRDDTLVSASALQAAFEAIGQNGSDALMEALAAAEPHLGTFLQEKAARVAGKLALSGAPQPIVAGLHGELLAACAIVYVAVRRGTYEIWEGTALDQRLRDLEVTTAAEEAAPPADADGALQEIVLLGIAPRCKRRVAEALRRFGGYTARQVRQLFGQLPAVLYTEVPSPVAAALQSELEEAGGVVSIQPMPPSPASPGMNPSDNRTSGAGNAGD